MIRLRPVFRRFPGLIACLLVFSLISNVSVVRAVPNPSPLGRISFDQEKPTNAAARTHFQKDSVVNELLQEAGLRGFKFDQGGPGFVEMADGIVAVAINGRRGSNQLVVVAGYYDPATGESTLAHAWYFKEKNGKQIQFDATYHTRGKKVRTETFTYDTGKRQWYNENGESVRGGPTRFVSFGEQVQAYTCQVRECKWVYTFASFWICAAVSVMTFTLLGALCGLVTQMIIESICEDVLYPDC